MVDREGLSFCNMGVVDIRGLDSKNDGSQAAFSIATIRANNPDWKSAEPRPSVKYQASRHIDCSKLADMLSAYSIKKARTARIRATLGDIIVDYVFNLESPKHLFCIHSRTHPESYYDRTVMNIPRKLTRMHQMPFPQVIIVTEKAEDSNRICRKLVNARYDSSDCGILNLDSRSLTDDGRDKHIERNRVMIGSIDKLATYFGKVGENRKLDDLAASVKFIIINSTEKIKLQPNFKGLMDYVADKFHHSWTRFIYMYNFVKAPISLLESVKICREFHKEGMFIEVDKPKVRGIFEKVGFELVVPPLEMADRLIASSTDSNGITLSSEKYNAIKTIATPHFQKLKKCSAIIHDLRVSRGQRERLHRQRVSRRERILIVTQNHHTARFVRMMLVPKTVSNASFNINTLVEYDSVEDVEKRNFEFRHGNLDVLVIDWKSIQSVLRGTVDTVIMYDRPHPEYFQTIMETQMENLTSRNCVKLRLIIFLHQTEDLFLLPEYIKFVEKYNKEVPQWFPPLYQKFLADLNEKRAERRLLGGDNTLVVQQDSDDTMQ